MRRSDENLTGVIRPSNIQGVMKPASGVIGSNRRALSTIDKNIIGAPIYHQVQKRGENAAVGKKNLVPVHRPSRPVTRNYASQLAGKEQLLVQEVKPIVQESDECIIIDSDYHDVPSYVQHTEAILQEIDGMDIEMEDMDEDEPIVDIDSCDKKNALAVTEYIDELYAYYKKSENLGGVHPNYMSQQFDINDRMRGILIDWLIEVHYKFELMEETLYLTVQLIDRFLAVHSVARKKLQLVGVTAMLLACKYEEVSVPVVEDLILISDKAYCRKEVLDMEKLMVNTLQFNLSVPTPYVFMRRFLKAAQATDKKLEMLSFFIIDLCLVEYEMLRFAPSLIAAAAIYTAQCALVGHTQWSKTIEKHTNYTEDQLMECAKLMVIFHHKSGTGKLTSVHKKYNTSKYGYAAKTAPAVFLVDYISAA